VAHTEHTDEKKPPTLQKTKYSAVDYSQLFTSNEKSDMHKSTMASAGLVPKRIFVDGKGIIETP